MIKPFGGLIGDETEKSALKAMGRTYVDKDVDMGHRTRDKGHG